MCPCVSLRSSLSLFPQLTFSLPRLTLNLVQHVITLPCIAQTFSGTTKRMQLELHLTTKHDDKKNKATFEECFGADCTAKA